MQKILKSANWTLMFILLLALLIRVGLSWHPGYGFDIGVYQGWAQSGAEFGMAQSYTKQLNGNMLPNYPPLAITMFTGVGHIYALLLETFESNPIAYRMYIKLPAIAADLLICGLLYLLLRRFHGPKAGNLAALSYALNPAAIYNSAIWGQTDAIYAMFLLAALTAWVLERRNIAAVCLACSVLFKVQAVVLFPLFAFLLAGDLRQLLRFTVVGILTVIVVSIPYAIGGTLEEVIAVYTGAVGHYGNVTIGAYNFWWSILADRGWNIESTQSPFGLLSYTQWGLVIFGGLYAYIVAVFRKKLRDPQNYRELFYCSALLSAAFFLFLTQMHERYLFPFVVFGIPMIFLGRRIAAAYWGICIAFTFNLMGVMPFSFIDKAIYRAFDAFDVFVASTIVWLFIFLLVAAHKRFN